METSTVRSRKRQRNGLVAMASWAIVGVAGMAALRADSIATPVQVTQIEQEPFKFTGLINANQQEQGSGVVVLQPNLVLSCAHVVFDAENELDPWLGEVRWYWKYHDSPEPAWTNGVPLRGYTRLSGYQYSANLNGVSFSGALELDVIVGYAYENLAGGDFAGAWPNGASMLLTSGTKLITGYPSGLYPDGDKDSYKMHASGPFSAAFEPARGSYLRVEGVAIGPGNSGGPIWMPDNSGSWRVAGVVASGSQKAEGSPINSTGVRALDEDAWMLLNQTIGLGPPANDNFAEATTIGGDDEETTGSNLGATLEANEPEHSTLPGGRSVWWAWTAPATGNVTFDTVGSLFDTLLAVYKGSSLSNLLLVSKDDDSAGGGASRVTFQAVAGTTYYVAVDAYRSAGGTVVLHRVPPPINDNFAARTALTGAMASVTGSNVSASRETGEVNHAGRAGGRSVWWSWTAPPHGTATVDTAGSNFDTLLAVYTGDSVSRLTLVASNNDRAADGTSKLTFAAVAGAAYQIAVDGSFGASGRIALAVRQGLFVAAPPQSQAVTLEGNATLSVAIAGSSTATFQWQKDGVALPGATKSSYSITNIQSADSGVYSVLIREPGGIAINSGAAITALPPYTFTTWAGTPRSGSADGLGAEARFRGPSGIGVDSAGNLVVAETASHTIRKIMPDGTVQTLAGLAGSSGITDGPGERARFDLPTGIAVDGLDNIYVADTFNNTIRKITPDGVVSTLAGSARNPPGSADGTASTARFFAPNRLAVDRAGNVFVADTLNFTIRKITPARVVSTVAGKPGIRGSADGPGSAARFSYPRDVAADDAGNIYVADGGNSAIRKITPDGTVSTLAGQKGVSGNADGASNAATFTNPVGIVSDATGNLFVADDYANTIRKIAGDGTVSTLAGVAGQAGNADGGPSVARFNLPTGVAADRAGNIYVTDAGNNTIRVISQAGAVRTLAGKPSFGNADGFRTAASFGGLDGLAADASGNVYVADTVNDVIRKISPAGFVTTLAGRAGVPGIADGVRDQARFDHPQSVAVDGAGNVFVPDFYNHTIRQITPDGAVRTLAGLAGRFGSVDGTGTAARFFHPAGVAVDTDGNVFVADQYNHTIRKISRSGTVITLAGSPGQFGSSDGTGSTARFNGPESVAVDAGGNIYVADYANRTVRKISPLGMVTTLAGSAGRFGRTDGPGNVATFGGPAGVAVDAAGFVYVADYGNNTIRGITPGGVVATLGGSALDVDGAADGIGPAARFDGPIGLAVDSTGAIYVADAGNNVIRKGVPFALVTQPQPQSVLVGENAVFKAGVLGNGPFSFQWMLNGVLLANQAGVTLTIPVRQRSNGGLYSVTVTAPSGSLTSTNALLRVLIPQHLWPPELQADGRIRISFQDPDGGGPTDLTRFEVQWRPDLPTATDAVWQKLSAPLIFTNGAVVIDDATAGGQTRRFYRVVER